MIRWMRLAGIGCAVAALSLTAATAQMHHDKGEHHEKAAKAKAERPRCPISGDPVDFSVKLTTDDGPVYFCCEGCIKKYKKDPAKYADKVAAQRKALEKLPRVQVVCPLSGEPVNPKISFEYNGQKVYFCCARCRARFAKNPEKYAGKLANCYCYQTRCPVSGEKIDPGSFTDLPTGQRVYFCCDDCKKPFLSKLEKYAPKLAEQGIQIDVDAVKKGLKAKGGKKHKKP